jgi:predicted PurR-regulated permease PerM
VLKVASESSRLVASYVAGALAIALIAGTVQFVAMKIAGVPFAAGLAVLVAVLDLIPMIGATIAGAVVVLVSLTVSTETAVAMLLVVIVYQQIENNIIQPLVQKKTISLSPFVIIVAVLIGSTLLEVIGALLALPVTASLKVVAEEFFLDESLLEDESGGEVAAASQ